MKLIVVKPTRSKIIKMMTCTKGFSLSSVCSIIIVNSEQPYVPNVVVSMTTITGRQADTNDPKQKLIKLY